MMDMLPNCPPMGSCWCYDQDEGPCVCTATERQLRVWSSQRDGLQPPMTSAQREWCLTQIAAVEGHERSDYETLNDAEIARGVLDAWRDFARDKGLY